MKIPKNSVFLFLLVILSTGIPVFTQATKNNIQSASTTQSITVARFDASPGVTLPATSVDVMMAEIVDELTKLKRFSQVKLETPAASPIQNDPNVTQDTELLLSGTIKQYAPGSQTLRYIIGLGAGKAKIITSFKITDKTTGKVLIEKDVEGTVWNGMWGGDKVQATRNTAKKIASETKKTLFK